MACTVSLRWLDQAGISKRVHVSTNKFYRKFETEVLANLVKVLITYRLDVVESISHVWLFATPWTVVCQAPLLFTNSGSLLKFMSIELGMLYNHLILCCPLLLLPSIFAFHLSQHLGFFQWVGSMHQVAKVLELLCQSFQWIFRVDFL